MDRQDMVCRSEARAALSGWLSRLPAHQADEIAGAQILPEEGTLEEENCWVVVFLQPQADRTGLMPTPKSVTFQFREAEYPTRSDICHPALPGL